VANLCWERKKGGKYLAELSIGEITRHRVWKGSTICREWVRVRDSAFAWTKRPQRKPLLGLGGGPDYSEKADWKRIERRDMTVAGRKRREMGRPPFGGSRKRSRREKLSLSDEKGLPRHDQKGEGGNRWELKGRRLPLYHGIVTRKEKRNCSLQHRR